MTRIFTTPGAEAAERWLRALALAPVPHWHAEIVILADLDTRFDLNVYAEEWGFCFQHAGRTSWIRVTDVPFVHGRDELELLGRTPDLLDIHRLLAELEAQYGISFRRATASVRSTFPEIGAAVRDWLLRSGAPRPTPPP